MDLTSLPGITCISFIHKHLNSILNTIKATMSNTIFFVLGFASIFPVINGLFYLFRFSLFLSSKHRSRIFSRNLLQLYEHLYSIIGSNLMNSLKMHTQHTRAGNQDQRSDINRTRRLLEPIANCNICNVKKHHNVAVLRIVTTRAGKEKTL